MYDTRKESTLRPVELELLKDYPLRTLLRRPPGRDDDRQPALLCFLHGYDEAAPLPIETALTRHGPLRAGTPPIGVERFLVLAPQLPQPGDNWHRYADMVERIVREQAEQHGCDLNRIYLTGFSFGGNGVFDLALTQPELWAALWAVDPTRVPAKRLAQPIWLSFGEVSRYQAARFINRLVLEPPVILDRQEHVWWDDGEDHVGSARLAYRDPRIYEWLLLHPMA